MMRTTAGKQQREQLSLLFKETVSLYWRLSADASAIYGLGDLSGPRRTLLLSLAEGGPQTVARLARGRGQSRQRLQPLVNALLDEGSLLAVANPMHKRSPLIMLTTNGEKRVRDILKTEGALMARLRLATPTRKLTEAAAVLREVRQMLEEQLPALLKR